MNDKPLISVCVPAYNHERYVRACVESICAQDWPRIELLVMDDGSTDATWMTLQDLKPLCDGRFERVVMERQKNQGTCVSFSRLGEMARGEYVLIVASDDQLLPGALSKLVRPMLDDPSIGLAVGRNEIMDDVGRKCFWTESQENVYDASQARYRDFTEQIEKTTGVSGGDARFGTYAALLLSNHVGNGQLIRRSCLASILPYRREAPLEDWWLHLQLSKVCRYAFVNEATFRYRWHTLNTIKQREKMLRFKWRTLLWEQDAVTRHPDGRWREIFRSVLWQEHRVLTFGRGFGVFRREALDRTELLLRWGRHERIVRTRFRFEPKIPVAVLVVVHVYYSECWPELRNCLRNIDVFHDVIVTYSDETAVARARQDLPGARFLRCENVGYDIWPFVKAIRSVDLPRYDFVLKLHTKRAFAEIPRSHWESYYTSFVSGDAWRRRLLAFVATPEAWRRALQTFARPDVGCVANPVLIAGRRVLGRPDPLFARATEACAHIFGRVHPNGRYVMGTMFLMRANALGFLRREAFNMERFTAETATHEEGWSHVCERLMGLAVESQGLRVVGWSGCLCETLAFRLKVIGFALARFVFRKKTCRDGHSIVKVLKIPVWKSRKPV